CGRTLGVAQMATLPGASWLEHRLGQIGEFGPVLEVMEREQTPWTYNALAAVCPTAKDAIPSLAKMVKSSELAVRVAATYALGGIATHATEAVTLIEALANDEDTAVRTAAEQALANIEREKKRASAMKK